MIDFTKPVTTRDGREVVIFGTDFRDSCPVKGYIVGLSPKTLISWHEDGAFYPRGLNCADLINPKARIKRTVYLNVYSNGGVVLHTTRGEAAKGGSSIVGEHRFACIPVDIDCEEGEGL